MQQRCGRPTKKNPVAAALNPQSLEPLPPQEIDRWRKNPLAGIGL